MALNASCVPMLMLDIALHRRLIADVSGSSVLHAASSSLLRRLPSA